MSQTMFDFNGQPLLCRTSTLPDLYLTPSGDITPCRMAGVTFHSHVRHPARHREKRLTVKPSEAHLRTTTLRNCAAVPRRARI